MASANHWVIHQNIFLRVSWFFSPGCKLQQSNNFIFLLLKLSKFCTDCSPACTAQWDYGNSFIKPKRSESLLCLWCITFPSIYIFLIICNGVFMCLQATIQDRLHRVLKSIFLKHCLLLSNGLFHQRLHREKLLLFAVSWHDPMSFLYFSSRRRAEPQILSSKLTGIILNYENMLEG